MDSGIEVWSPPYTNVHGGVRALHVLRDEINKRGVPSWLHYERHDPNAHVIYPEIVTGNPLAAHTYTRWLLNKVPDPQPHDWAWEAGFGTDLLLTVNIIEHDLWYPRNMRRSGVAYWVGKGQYDGSVVPEGAHEINRQNHPNRQELAEFISSLDYLISFDPFTAVSVEAVNSGTPVLVHAPGNQWTREEMERHKWAPYGIAWSPGELDKARAEVHLAYDYYQTLDVLFSDRIDNFLNHLRVEGIYLGG